MPPPRINRDHEDLIGRRFKSSGGIIVHLVEDVDHETEGKVWVYNTCSKRAVCRDAGEVRDMIQRNPLN